MQKAEQKKLNESLLVSKWEDADCLSMLVRSSRKNEMAFAHSALCSEVTKNGDADDYDRRNEERKTTN